VTTEEERAEWTINSNDTFWSIAQDLFTAEHPGATGHEESMLRLHFRLLDLNQHANSTRNVGVLISGDRLTVPSPPSVRKLTEHGPVSSLNTYTQDDLAEVIGRGGVQGATFRGDIAFPEMSVPGDLCLCACTFDGKLDIRFVEVAGSLCLRGAQIAGRANVHGVTITGDLVLENAKVGGDIIVESSKVSGSLAMGGAVAGHAVFVANHNEIGGELYVGRISGAPKGVFVTDTRVRRGIYGHALTLTGSLHIERVQTTSSAAMVAIGASTIGGELVFRELRAEGGVSLRDSSVTDACTILDVETSADVDLSHVGLSAGADLHITCATLCLESAVVTGAPALWRLATTRIRARRLRLEDGGHITLSAEDVDLSDAAFPSGTFIRGNSLVRKAGAEPVRPALLGLQGAVLTGVALSSVSLEHCRFVGAHNLDLLRVEDDVTFCSVPRDGRHRLRTRRRVIAAERALRAARGQAAWSPPLPLQDDREEELTPNQIAALYRSLRKGSEDRSNQPGAADFYYGEMEMRRAGAHGVERLLLNLYWFTSGYALRSWRALACFLVLIIGATVLSLTVVHPVPAAATPELVEPGVGTTPRVVWVSPSGDILADPPPNAGTVQRPTFWTALAENVEQATSLGKEANSPSANTAERWMQLALRMLGPVFLGLALLSIRGRLRR
jgi:hypothetical protein